MARERCPNQHRHRGGDPPCDAMGRAGCAPPALCGPASRPPWPGGQSARPAAECRDLPWGRDFTRPL